MAEPTPIIAAENCALFLAGRQPATGDPVSPVRFRLAVRLRVRSNEFTWVNALGLGDIPVWVVADSGAKQWYWPFSLDENAGQFGTMRWFEDTVNLTFPDGFKPSATAVRFTVLHGEWQRGVSGVVGRDVSDTDIVTEYRKGAASELWLGQSSSFRIPDDTSGDDDLYGGNQPWYVKATNSLVSTVKTVGLVGVAAYAATRAYQSKR